MKIVTKPFQLEESLIYCDKHTEKLCYSEVRIHSWYGSSFDMEYVVGHLCDECISSLKSILDKEFNIKLQLENYE